MTSIDSRRARLLWRCRRGMRELDLVLQAFADRRLEQLGATELDTFEKLLDCQDNDILDWLMGRATPPTPELSEMVADVALGAPAAASGIMNP